MLIQYIGGLPKFAGYAGHAATRGVLGKRVNRCVNNAGIWLCLLDSLSAALVLLDVTSVEFVLLRVACVQARKKSIFVYYEGDRCLVMIMRRRRMRR